MHVRFNAVGRPQGAGQGQPHTQAVRLSIKLTLLPQTPKSIMVSYNRVFTCRQSMPQAARELADQGQPPTPAGAAAAIFALRCLHELQPSLPDGGGGGSGAGGGSGEVQPRVRAYLPLPALQSAVELLASLQAEGLGQGVKVCTLQHWKVKNLWFIAFVPFIMPSACPAMRSFLHA